MRHLLWATLVGAAMLLGSARPAHAQLYGMGIGANGYVDYYNVPGNYGTFWGTPSFGAPRTYSVFSSPYGAGYGYGYYPYAYFPGYYGFRIFRPGFVTPGYMYGTGYYGTMSTPYLGTTGPLPPPIGVAAPGFGPPPYYAY
jgi:hypothetical protein